MDTGTHGPRITPCYRVSGTLSGLGEECGAPVLNPITLMEPRLVELPSHAVA